jgi:hypothetical protein
VEQILGNLCAWLFNEALYLPRVGRQSAPAVAAIDPVKIDSGRFSNGAYQGHPTWRQICCDQRAPNCGLKGDLTFYVLVRREDNDARLRIACQYMCQGKEQVGACAAAVRLVDYLDLWIATQVFLRKRPAIVRECDKSPVPGDYFANPVERPFQ